ncbi:protein TANC2-like [Mizuhopecten yessoensis]|uniref:protein TANC2-like n=1 Tax=Mizuhopecten yessoensis TaxID=6573 RepID=UPI000B458861|nr:protein TANC2-like [Mizuhopecten yessoensis]
MDDRATSKLLFRAIMKGQYKPVKINVDGGADINTVNKNGQTPLMKAYLELDTSSTPTIDTSSASYLASSQTEYQTRIMDDRATSKLLFRAIMKGQYKPVKIIVDGGADKDTTNENGQTPLMKAYLELDTSSTPTIDTSSASCVA